MIYTVTLNPSVDRTLHVDELTVGGLNRATSVATHLAGKGVNVSVALQQLGVRSVLLGLAGGATGRQLAEGLAARGLSCAFCEVAGETRSNLTILEDGCGRTTKLNEPGPKVTEAELDQLMGMADRVGTDDLCVLSGSLPPGVPAGSYARLARRMRERGAFVALDASGEPFRQALVARPHLIKPNVAEAGELLGCSLEGKAAWAEALQALHAMGAERVLLSLGPQGAASYEDGLAWWARPPGITEASAVGAGDALLAGWVYAWQRDLLPPERLRWAVASGTAAATLDGSAMPSRSLVEDVLAQVEVESLGGP